MGEIFFPLSFFMQIAVPPDTANSHAEILNESNEPVQFRTFWILEDNVSQLTFQHVNGAMA